MFLLPLWPKETLKVPLFTVALLGANLLTFLVAWPLQMHQASNVGQDDFQRTAQKLVDILLDPDSGLNDSDRAFLKGQNDVQPYPSPALTDFLKQTQSNETSLHGKARYDWDLVYPVFESYQRSIAVHPHGTSVFKVWGFNPDQSWFPGIVTHQFLHEGWIHFIFNMIFLWIAASIAEETLGGHLIWVYLTGGIAAALAQVQYGIPSGISLVGASGAISALMGFCLLAKPQAKVKLLYVVFLSLLPKCGVFDCPLWFFLPIWLLTQMFMALMIIDKSAVSTAYAAHIGGFVFGCLVGLAWGAFNHQVPSQQRA